MKHNEKDKEVNTRKRKFESGGQRTRKTEIVRERERERERDMRTNRNTNVLNGEIA